MANPYGLGRLLCKLFGHKEFEIPTMFKHPKKGDAISRTWDCPRCGEATFKTYVWRPHE